jgi:Protein of unknown function (DUF4233)
MRSLQRSMCAAILCLEAIVLGLTTPVMISLSDVQWQVALSVGLGLAVVALVVAGALRKPVAYHLGWALQVAAVALGFVVPVMFGLGAVFLALWASAFFVGRRIDDEKRSAAAQL